MKEFFITGIGTGVGKTIISACISQAYNASYWKPIQAGVQTDSDFVRDHTDCEVLPEVYRLKEAISPHAAALHEGVNIELEKITIPSYQRKYLFVEGVGGLLSPINSELTNLDMIKKLKLPVILVAGNYLGSINHCLLTLEVLKNSKQNILGIVFSGKANQESESYIEKHSGVNILCKVPEIAMINRSGLNIIANYLKNNINLGL